jgi:hypothetical protein
MMISGAPPIGESFGGAPELPLGRGLYSDPGEPPVKSGTFWVGVPTPATVDVISSERSKGSRRRPCESFASEPNREACLPHKPVWFRLRRICLESFGKQLPDLVFRLRLSVRDMPRERQAASGNSRKLFSERFLEVPIGLFWIHWWIGSNLQDNLMITL